MAPKFGQEPSPLLQKLWLQVLGYGLGILTYGLLLQLTLPAWLSAFFQKGFILPLLAFSLWCLSFRLRHRLEPFISFGITLVIFALPLTLLWSTGRTGSALIGGILPWSDTVGYFRIAQSLLDGRDVYLGFSRPFFPGYLAVLLGLAQRNLMVVQALLTGGVAIACYLASREVRRTHGNVVAVTMLTGIFLFFTPYLGSLMTENLGIVMGALSFALLWRGATQRRQDLLLLGIFLLTLGLCARMAAIFILPLVVWWGDRLLHQRRHPGWFFWKGMGLVILGLGLNALCSQIISDTPYVSFGNYSFVLYGLLTGGKWSSAINSYPEMAQMSPSEQATFVYGLCRDIIRQDPFSLPVGLVRAYGTTLGEGTARLLIRFVQGVPLWFLINVVVRPLLLVGIAICLWAGRQRPRALQALTVFRERSPVYGLLLAYVAGTWLSAPLAPISDALWRPYATTMIGLYALLGLGLGAVVLSVGELWQRRQGNLPPRELWLQSPTHWGRYPLASLLGFLVMGMAVLGPLGMKALIPQYVEAQSPCLGGQITVPVYINLTNAIYLHGEQAIAQSRVPNLRVSDFQEGLQPLLIRPEQRTLGLALKRLQPGNTLLPSVNHASRLMLLRTELMPEHSGHYIACGKVEPFPRSSSPERTFLRVSSLHPQLPT